MGEIFVIPEAKHNTATQKVPGTDGEKMSKSRNNFINIFLPEKKLKKQIKNQNRINHAIHRKIPKFWSTK